MMPTWLKGSLLLAITLSAGIAIGVMAERSHMHGRSTSPDVSHMLHSHVMNTLSQSLKLDSSQHKAIRETLQRHQSHIDSAWGAMRPHVSATLDSTHAAIMNLLRPEQRQAFERIITHAHGRGGH